MCAVKWKRHTHTQTMLTRRLLESGKISPKVQAREGEAKQSLLLWCGNEHKTIHKRRRQRKAIQIRRGRCNCFQAACGTQQTTPCGMRCCPVFHFCPCLGRCPCPVCLLFGGGTGTRIKSHFTAQLNRSGGAARFNHSQKESNKAAKEMRERKQRREGERKGERRGSKER